MRPSFPRTKREDGKRVWCEHAIKEIQNIVAYSKDYDDEMEKLLCESLVEVLEDKGLDYDLADKVFDLSKDHFLRVRGSEVEVCRRGQGEPVMVIDLPLRLWDKIRLFWNVVIRPSRI